MCQHAEEVRSSAKSGVNWKKYFLEFLSMFFAVILAFALNSWNDNRKINNAEMNILKEIHNGLKLDSIDVDLNVAGHELGLQAVVYFRKLLKGAPVARDSFPFYRRMLVRDFISIQNTSGYESLKSQGLDVIKNDELRVEIISLYEYNYSLVEKIEEQYAAQQYFEAYNDRFNDAVSPYTVFDEKGSIETINTPLIIPKGKLNSLMLDLNSIEWDRKFTLKFYREISSQIVKVKDLIDKELKRKS